MPGLLPHARRAELEGRRVEPIEEPQPAAQQHRRYADVQLVHQPGAQALLRHVAPADHQHILLARGGLGLPQRAVRAVGHKCHGQPVVLLGRPGRRRVRHHEDRHLEFVSVRVVIRVAHGEGAPAHHHRAGGLHRLLHHVHLAHRFHVRIQRAQAALRVIDKAVQRHQDPDDYLAHGSFLRLDYCAPAFPREMGLGTRRRVRDP